MYGIFGDEFVLEIGLFIRWPRRVKIISINFDIFVASYIRILFLINLITAILESINIQIVIKITIY